MHTSTDAEGHTMTIKRILAWLSFPLTKKTTAPTTTDPLAAFRPIATAEDYERCGLTYPTEKEIESQARLGLPPETVEDLERYKAADEHFQRSKRIYDRLRPAAHDDEDDCPPEFYDPGLRGWMAEQAFLREHFEEADDEDDDGWRQTCEAAGEFYDLDPGIVAEHIINGSESDEEIARRLAAVGPR